MMINPEGGPAASRWTQMILPDEGDNESLRAYLSEGIAAIHRDYDFQLLPNAYMDLYTAVWRLISRVPNKDGRDRSSIMVPAKTIYQNLADFLAEHLQAVAQRLQSTERNLLLEAYLTEWDQYSAAATRIDRLLNLVNRHWVKRNIDEGKGDIYRIRTLHFVQWRAHVWGKIAESVIDAAQCTIQSGDGKAAMFQNVMERFASLRVDDFPFSPSTNSRAGICARLEASFVPEIEEHDRNIQQINSAVSSHN